MQNKPFAFAAATLAALLSVATLADSKPASSSDKAAPTTTAQTKKLEAAQQKSTAVAASEKYAGKVNLESWRCEENHVCLMQVKLPAPDGRSALVADYTKDLQEAFKASPETEGVSAAVREIKNDQGNISATLEVSSTMKMAQ